VWIEEPSQASDDVVGICEFMPRRTPLKDRRTRAAARPDTASCQASSSLEAVDVLPASTALRAGGVNEVLAVPSPRREFGVQVCPHAAASGL